MPPPELEPFPGKLEEVGVAFNARYPQPQPQPGEAEGALPAVVTSPSYGFSTFSKRQTGPFNNIYWWVPGFRGFTVAPLRDMCLSSGTCIHNAMQHSTIQYITWYSPTVYRTVNTAVLPPPPQGCIPH